MIHISNFLQKFLNKEPPEKRVKGAVREIISRRIGVLISKEAIRVSNRTLYITESAAMKSEVFMQKSEILAEMKIIFGEKAPSEIL